MKVGFFFAIILNERHSEKRSDSVKFSENLRNLRKEKDFSQEYLAEVMKVSRQTISKWENNLAMPDLKKLAELSELFCVGINELLGIEKEGEASVYKNENEFSTEEYVEQTQRVLSAITENQNKIYQKNTRTVTIAFIVFAVIITFLLFSSTINLSSRIENFASRIENLESNFNSLSENAGSIDGNAYSTADDCISYEILEVLPETPYKIRCRIQYMPEEYKNGETVYFIALKDDGETEKYETTEKNGVFTAEENIDLIKNHNAVYYVCTRNGENITKSEIEINFESEYLGIYEGLTLEITANRFKGICYVSGEGYQLTWESSVVTITKARLIGISGNETIFSRDLKIQTTKTDPNQRYAVIENYSFENKNGTEAEFYLELTDENGVIYRIKNTDINSEAEFEMIFTVEGKRKSINVYID